MTLGRNPTIVDIKDFDPVAAAKTIFKAIDGLGKKYEHQKSDVDFIEMSDLNYTNVEVVEKLFDTTLKGVYQVDT